MSSRIIDARKRIGMSQKELAALLGIAPNTLSGYEKGKHRADSDTLGHIASITGCTIDFLIGRSDTFDAHYEKEKSPELAYASPEDEDVSWAMEFLISRGFIKAGQDLSERDVDFLQHLVGLIGAWFKK